MDESRHTEVFAVLLSFGMLDKKQRELFADHFNQFTFLSPQQQRLVMGDWSRACSGSTNPVVKGIAESAAVYAVPKEKRRKKSIAPQA